MTKFTREALEEMAACKPSSGRCFNCLSKKTCPGVNPFKKKWGKFALQQMDRIKELEDACRAAHVEWALHGSLTDSDKVLREVLGISDEQLLADYRKRREEGK